MIDLKECTLHEMSEILTILAVVLLAVFCITIFPAEIAKDIGLAAVSGLLGYLAKKT